MLNPDDIINRVKSSYLVLLGPDISRAQDQEAIRRIIQLAPEVHEQICRYMIRKGLTWRERLIGVVISVAKGPPVYLDSYIDALQDPKGFELVPIFAAIYLSLERTRVKHLPMDLNLLARSDHDWEVGWGLEKVCYELGIEVKTDPGDVGPITGLNFKRYVEMYRWIREQPQGSKMGKKADAKGS